MKILCLGPAGTYGHEAATIAAKRLKRESLEIEFCQRNVDVIRRVDSEECYGVVPVENSTAGLVPDIVKDFWLEQSTDSLVCVVGEIQIAVSHNLLVHSSTRSMGEIIKVISHPQALAQCRTKLARFGLKKFEAVDSTALAARYASEPLVYPNIAAISSRFAAEFYGLKMIAECIEDSPGNSTRFHILGSDENQKPTGNDRTAVLFWIPNRPGALLSALGTMWRVNMSSIHSIPLGTPSAYAFYCEFDEHKFSDVGGEVLLGLEKLTDRLLVLGSYPKEV